MHIGGLYTITIRFIRVRIITVLPEMRHNCLQRSRRVIGTMRIIHRQAGMQQKY